MQIEGLANTARDLREARRSLEALEVQALAGIVDLLSSAVDKATETVERLEKMGPQEWMDTEQAAAYLGKSRHAFDKIIAAEDVPRHYLSGRRPMFSRRELDEWLLSR